MGGGDKGDGGAAIAQANAQAAREAAAAEQSRWERQMEQTRQDKAAEQQQLQQEEAKRQQQLQYERDDAARQAEAQAKTGIPATSFLDTRSDKAKAYSAASAGLPGFDSLKKRAMVQTPNGEGVFGGTGNSPTGTFNATQVGGRRYL